MAAAQARASRGLLNGGEEAEAAPAADEEPDAGLVDAFGKQFFPNYAAFLVYTAMIAVLIVRPQGLMRSRA